MGTAYADADWAGEGMGYIDKRRRILLAIEYLDSLWTVDFNIPIIWRRTSIHCFKFLVICAMSTPSDHV